MSFEELKDKDLRIVANQLKEKVALNQKEILKRS
jgi:hypothetical protein